ncbi:MAG: tetratricopeptide repeat protein [Candidatus Krumholzibacteria bacterium]|nr:tetratricopeptide repeat protein [Candidatus Krumholzibacteria bacterium]
MPELRDEERKVLLGFASRVERNDPGALNNLGVVYFRKGMYEEAMEQFKEALKVDPKFDLARENLQYVFAETGIEDADVRRWRDEVKRDPENFEAMLRLGVSFQNMGRFREAAEMLGAVVEKNPDHTMARFHLAITLKAQGLYQQALEHYLYIGVHFAKSAVFHTDLGEVYYNIGRTDEAIAELNAAIKLDADYWRSHFLLSFAYGDNGQLQEALEESRVASRLNPSFQNTEANLALSRSGAGGAGDASRSSAGKEVASLESTSFTLGMAYRERGFPKEALKEFQKALRDMSDADRVHIEIGKIHVAEGSMGAAAEAFLKTLEANAENVEAYRLLGCVYHLQGEYYESALCYLQAFRLNSADADTMNNLGVLLYQVGLKEEAERMFKKGLNLKIYHQELNYNFLNCHLLKEEYMMAENLIQRFEAFMGKSPLLYEKHAILNYKLNRLTLALFDIESALSLDKNHSDALYLKSLIFLREEDFQAAINAVLEAAKISPRYTGLAFFLAMDERQRVTAAKVDAQMPIEPEDDLIELLQCGIGRRFDKIKESLVSVVERGMKRIGERGPGANANPGDAPAASAPVERKAASAESTDRKAASPAAPAGPMADSAAGAGDDSAHALIEALSDISLEEDDSI